MLKHDIMYYLYNIVIFVLYWYIINYATIKTKPSGLRYAFDIDILDTENENEAISLLYALYINIFDSGKLIKSDSKMIHIRTSLGSNVESSLTIFYKVWHDSSISIIVTLRYICSISMHYQQLRPWHYVIFVLYRCIISNSNRDITLYLSIIMLS
jgi:hypothetical protein